jgi:hypothetical protein
MERAAPIHARSAKTPCRAVSTSHALTAVAVTMMPASEATSAPSARSGPRAAQTATPREVTEEARTAMGCGSVSSRGRGRRPADQHARADAREDDAGADDEGRVAREREGDGEGPAMTAMTRRRAPMSRGIGASNLEGPSLRMVWARARRGIDRRRWRGPRGGSSRAVTGGKASVMGASRVALRRAFSSRIGRLGRAPRSGVGSGSGGSPRKAARQVVRLQK